MGDILRVRNKDGKFEGIPSIQGESAYDIAVRKGFEGTEEEWLASLGGGEVFGGYIEDLTPEEVSEALQKGARVKLYSREHHGVFWTSFELVNNGHFYSTAVGSTRDDNDNDVWFVAKLIGFVNFGMPFSVNTATIPTDEHINGLIAAQVGDISTALDELHAYAQALVNGGATE